MDLREAGVCERGAAAVRSPRRGDVAAHRVRREVVDVAVAARRQHHGVGGVALDLPRDQVAGDDAARLAVHDHDVEELVAVVNGRGALSHLALECRVGAKEELLPGLAAAVEGALDEDAAERARRQHAAVLAVERDALGDSLVDDVGGGLSEAPDVRLARAEVAPLDRVDEEALDRVALVRVVLGRVDAPLGRDGMGSPGRVLEAERVDCIALAGQGRRRARARKTGADNDHTMVGALARPHQPMGVKPRLPFVLERAFRNPAVESHTHRHQLLSGQSPSLRAFTRSPPSRTRSGPP